MRKYNKKKKKRQRQRVCATLPDLKNTETKMLKSTIDYKNLVLLRHFISSEGKILPRRLTRLSAKKQRKMANAIKTARVASLLLFINR